MRKMSTDQRLENIEKKQVDQENAIANLIHVVDNIEERLERIENEKSECVDSWKDIYEKYAATTTRIEILEEKKK